MATIQDIKTKLLNANALGRTNLAEQGVELSADATTYDIMQAIAEIVGSSGSGTEYTSIVYNTDNTITLTDKDGAIHTMSCTYEDGKLIGVTYDGKAVDLTYNGDVLVKLGNTVVDIANAPATSGATFNIAYGETAPEDTSKLWVKANEPANVSVGSDVEVTEKIRTSNAHIPTSSSRMGCAAVGTKIYLFGGCDSIDSYLNTINIFDTINETISTLSATLPTACENISCAAVGTKIYLFGGDRGYNVGLNTINVFDTETKTITTLPTTLPTVCYDMGCTSIGTKIYLFGGYNNGGGINTINVFDTETETITTLPITLPRNYGNIGSVSIGNKIYLFGGDNGNDISDTINVFDAETETITTLTTTLPVYCGRMGCATVDNKIYLFGGQAHGGSVNTINVFDAKTESITTLSTTLPTGCDDMGCASVEAKIYLFGGENASECFNRISIFYNAHQLTQGNIKIQPDLLNNKFNLINTENARVEIGVEKVYIGNANNEAELCEAYLHNGTEWVVIE